MFKQVFLVLVAFFAFIAMTLATAWVFQGNEFFLYRYFAPKEEAVRRQVFEQSKAYNQGMVQELQNMQFQYVRATKEQRASLRSIILHRVADYDRDKLPDDLRSFISSLEREMEMSR